MRRISFKMRVMIFTGIVMMTTSILLTVLSMYNARKQITIAVTSSIADTLNGSQDSIEFYPNAEGDNDVYFSIPADELGDGTIFVNNASRQFNITGIVYTILITALGMAAAYFFAGKSLKPIKTLNDAVLNITEKNLDERVPVHGAKDEISSLTKSFNAMLDRLDESFVRQKRFSSNAAHELKTPVAVIKTGIQMLELDTDADIDDYRETVSLIKRNVGRLSDVVDDLMTLTNENCELDEEIVSLNTMLKSCVMDVKPAYNGRNIEAVYDFKEEEAFVKCNETLAYRVFYNIIENAFKYNIDNGKVLIGIYDENERIHVSILNTGPYLSEEALSNIWEPFYCIDPSRSRKLGGAGLGLSIVKEIAERFGWQINVKSEPSGTTVFTVSIEKFEE